MEAFVLSVTRRSPLEDPTQSRTRIEFTRRGVFAVVGFWAAVSLLAGTATFLSLRQDLPPPSWRDTTLPPLVAGAFWVPLTLGIAWLAVRLPPVRFEPDTRIRPRALVLHLLAGGAVSFVLNAGFVAVTQSHLLKNGPAFIEAVRTSGLGYLHLNAGAYWAVVLAVLVWPVVRDRQVANGPASGAQTLTVRSGTATVRVRVSEVRWIEAAGDYVTLHLADTHHLLSERLKTLEKRLDADQFVRVHRSAIVNVDAVRKLRHLGHGDYQAHLDEGTTVRVSRTRRARLQEVLDRREVRGPEEP